MMGLDLIAELEAIIVAFEAAGIEYALCGGLALAAHGHPRMTVDIDLLVLPAMMPAALAAARTVGFDVPARKMVFGLEQGAPREIQRVSKIDPSTGRLLSLDLLVVAGDYEQVWRDRLVVPWQARTMVVVSRDGLATMKRLAGRPQDLVDLDVLQGRTHDDDA